MLKIFTSIALLFGLSSSISAAGELGGAGGSSLARSLAPFVQNGILATPSNLESIQSDQEMPITELSPDRFNELSFDLQFRSTAPMPNDPHARAIRVGNSIISQDVDRFVTEVKTYEE